MLLKKEMHFLAKSLLRYSEMLTQMIIWVAIWATVLGASWARKELTRTNCEWTRIWTI